MKTFSFLVGQYVLQRVGDDFVEAIIIDRAVINGRNYYKSDAWNRFLPESAFRK